MSDQNEGFGVASAGELAELRKALEIGYTRPPVSGGDALRVESLDGTLKVVTFEAVNARLWGAIPKDKAYSTVEEYDRLSAYGSDGGGFTNSGEVPQEEDSTYSREFQTVKYLGTKRGVHHPATLVRTVPGDVVGQETKNGVNWMVGRANHNLYYGDADSIPQAWNGLRKQSEDGGCLVIDLLGEPLADANIEDGAQHILDQFGVPSRLFSNSRVFTDFAKGYYDLQRLNRPGDAKPGIVGSAPRGFESIAGTIEFEPDPFVSRGGIAPATATHSQAPSAPTCEAGYPFGTDGLFLTADAGDYKWQVTAINRFGESAPSALTDATAITAGESVDITITDGGGTYPATGYKVYRTEKDGAVAYFVGYLTPRAKISDVYQATTDYTDNNAYRPRCYTGLMLDMNPQVNTFKQLAPLMKMDLARTSPKIEWMQLLYGTPIVFAPRKNVVFRNIGQAS